MEMREEVAGATPEGSGRAEGMEGAQDEPVEDQKLQDFIIEAAPQSPTLSFPFSDTGFSPPSDGGTTNDPVVSEDEGICSATSSAPGESQSCGFSGQPKRRKRLDDKGGGEHEPIRKRPKGVKRSDDEDNEDCGLSRSAAASRKLRESVRSGTFVVDEKRKRFETKCRGFDGHASFRYKGSWQVRHSKCSRWVTMQEPYNLVRFGDHVGGCKRAGAKDRDGTIDLFFKPRDPTETGTTRMAQPSSRAQIFAGARAKLKETLIATDQLFVSKERPCLGLGKDQDERVVTYISRAIVEGAGSHSDTHVATLLFGKGVKYSELDDTSKRYVAAAQVHSQKWKISHSLGAVFSVDCMGKIIISDRTQGSVCSRCLDLLKLEAFKKALDTKPPRLENLKFTPHRYRNAATNLGINLAKIEGVSNLLEKVSFCNFYTSKIQE